MHDRTDEHMLARILEDNDQLAAENRHHFEHMGAFAVNFMSAPGAGKTTLIVETAKALRDRIKLSVIEGDMVGDLDAKRMEAQGIKAYQISTGRSCHLDAAQIARLLHSDSPPQGDLILIENVGNLVCPAEFPLGEEMRVVLLSVTEGDDKPIKYPVIFHNCDAVVLTKIDLLKHVEFSQENVIKAISSLNPDAKVFLVSSKSGEGMKEWIDWLEESFEKGKLAIANHHHSHHH